jgi:hypothetical protein
VSVERGLALVQAVETFAQNNQEISNEETDQFAEFSYPTIEMTCVKTQKTVKSNYYLIFTEV